MERDSNKLQPFDCMRLNICSERLLCNSLNQRRKAAGVLIPAVPSEPLQLFTASSTCRTSVVVVVVAVVVVVVSLLSSSSSSP